MERRTIKGYWIYSLSADIWRLFSVLIASDKIKYPTSGKWSELCDCNYSNSEAFKCLGDAWAAGVEN